MPHNFNAEELQAIREGARLARQHNMRDATKMLLVVLALAMIFAWIVA